MPLYLLFFVVFSKIITAKIEIIINNKKKPTKYILENSFLLNILINQNYLIKDD